MNKGQDISPRRVFVTRGPYSIAFQMARAFITAAAAAANRDTAEAIGLIDRAITELTGLKQTMIGSLKEA